MRVINSIQIILALSSLTLFSFLVCADAADSKSESKGSSYVIVGSKENVFAPYGSDDDTQKIFKRNDLQDEGRWFEKHGLYDQALEKYQEALKYASKKGSDRNMALGSIVDIHRFQGKFELALQEHDYFLKKAPSFPASVDMKFQLEALIKARDTKSNQPIYDHIDYLKKKYKDTIPPKKYSFESLGPVATVIYLYNYIGDANSGIAYMTDVLSCPTIDKWARVEYEKVKAAFEEDIRTTQKGHLAKVYETSEYLPW